MCDRIRHRGPDEEGYFSHETCAIGMRRLSIIDVSGGHQPIANEDETLWVVFNGEIYNFQTLRAELAAAGHSFRTLTDTEVLVHLYEEEREQCVRHLRGMFAFAIYDTRRRSLFLARDRFGKKPLYYADVPDGLIFGSELKCLLATELQLTIDKDALRYYFLLGFIPDPFTPYIEIRKLEAGSWLLFEPEKPVRMEQYWKAPYPAEKPPCGLTEEEATRQVRVKFDEAVRTRLIADVPLGAFLSGGIDSSCVVASMAVQTQEPVKTFSVGFSETEFNELEYARLVAQRYKTDHHEIIVEPDSASLIYKIVNHCDEPFADSSCIPTYLISEYAAQYVKVALSGDGGDELFDGYESFFLAQRLEKWNLVPGLMRQWLSAVASLLPYSAYGKNFLHMISRPTTLERYFEGNYAPFKMRQAMLLPEWVLPTDAAFLVRHFCKYLVGLEASTLSNAVYFAATAQLTGDMLVKVDRMSMANSLEVRCPFLDTELAEFAFSLPHLWKMKLGRGKHILLQSMGDRLPREIFRRGKMGFGVPLGKWFRGPLRGFVYDFLLSDRFLNRGIVSPGFLRAMVKEHESGRRDNNHWLWALLILEIWFSTRES